MNYGKTFAIAALLLLSIGPAIFAQQSGSIYTTDSKAEVENIFNQGRAVYFAGGPGPNAGCSGNGLVDGNYYFQVTDPSGSTLLSSDDVAAREVIVSEGVIAGVVSGGHSTKSGPCDSKIVQLIPFDPTPSNGGEYKVWFTPVDFYIPGEGSFGFLSSFSKTDSFKLKGTGPSMDQVAISGTVYYDYSENGVYDPGEPYEVPIPGWKIQIESGGVITETFTDMDGHYEFIRDLDSSTHVLTSVAPQPGYVGIPGGRWVAMSPTPVTVVADVPEITVDFGTLYMVFTPELSRSKGYWHNAGEAELLACDPEWRYILNGLCLRTNFSNPEGEEGTLFTVTTEGSFEEAYQQLKDYLVGDPALGVLAFNLSVQVAAGHLNHYCGVLQTTAYIDRMGDDILISFEELAEIATTMLCDPRSANTGPGGDLEWREILNTACPGQWDGMNNGDNLFSKSEAPPTVDY